MRRKIVASMFTWVSHLTNMVLLINWPLQLKLLILWWINLVQQWRVKPWSLMMKAWMKKAYEVSEWDLAGKLAS